MDLDHGRSATLVVGSGAALLAPASAYETGCLIWRQSWLPGLRVLAFDAFDAQISPRMEVETDLTPTTNHPDL